MVDLVNCLQAQGTEQLQGELGEILAKKVAESFSLRKNETMRKSPRFITEEEATGADVCVFAQEGFVFGVFLVFTNILAHWIKPWRLEQTLVFCVL